MNFKPDSRLFALPTLVTLALTGLGAKAQADIVVLKQHNYIQVVAGLYYNTVSESSDSLTSWTGTLSQIFGSHSASSTLTSTIAANKVNLDSLTHAKAPPRDYYDPFVAIAEATTQLQFTVSATRLYKVVSASKGVSAPVIQLLRDGIVVLSGPFDGTFIFEIGHTYEIDASAQAWAGFGMGTDSSGYRFSLL